MEETYNEIVEKWYVDLRSYFMLVLKKCYPRLTLEDAENIYQDTFLILKKNMDEGKVEKGSNWKSYIMSLGLHIASHETRKLGKTDRLPESENPKKNKRYNEDTFDDDEIEWGNDPEAIGLLNEALNCIPEKCKKIMQNKYYNGLDSKEIAEELGYSSDRVVISTHYKCWHNFRNMVKRLFKEHNLLCYN